MLRVRREQVAVAPHGADAVRRAGVAELLAQVRDAHVERAVETVVLALVQLQVQRLARLDLAGAAREEKQQVELVARERRPRSLPMATERAVALIVSSPKR